MKVRIPHITRVGVSWLPVAGVGTFITLYWQAASLYPGGTRAHREIRGYSHLSNYWCDLLDRVSYSGSINHGRPFAVLATIILPVLLVPFWLQVPILFRDDPGLRRLVQATGPASMVLSTLIFTSLHDFAVNVASILGFVAVVATICGLVGKRCAALIGVALLSMIFATTNYLMWQTSTFLWMMPMVQKAAFASFFIWIIATTCAIRRAFTTDVACEANQRPM
jgi:hypothetical protein